MHVYVQTSEPKGAGRPYWWGGHSAPPCWWSARHGQSTRRDVVSGSLLAAVRCLTGSRHIWTSFFPISHLFHFFFSCSSIIRHGGGETGCSPAGVLELAADDCRVCAFFRHAPKHGCAIFSLPLEHGCATERAQCPPAAYIVFYILFFFYYLPFLVILIGLCSF